MSGSLFDRLASDEDEEAINPKGDQIDARVRSIKRNLARVLNVRAGGAGSAPELGVVDFNDSAAQSGDLIKDAIASIESCIREYEPRLGQVDVKHVPEANRPLELQFAIVAYLPVSTGHERIRIDIMMEEGRSCRVV